MFTCQKLLKFCKTCFHGKKNSAAAAASATTKETALAPFKYISQFYAFVFAIKSLAKTPHAGIA